MQKKKRDPKHWLILALLNILLVEYPVGLYFQAYDDASRVMAAFALGVVAFLLAIADMFAVILVFAK